MGFDKAAARRGNQRLIDIVYRRLESQCGSVLISGQSDYDLDIPYFTDSSHVPHGPVGAILTAAAVLGEQPSGFFTAPVDGPNVPDDLCERLYAPSSSCIAADKTGTHPTFGWWRMADLNNARKNIDARDSISLMALAEMCQANPIMWRQEDCFLNINTQDEFDAFLKM